MTADDLIFFALGSFFLTLAAGYDHGDRFLHFIGALSLRMLGIAFLGSWLIDAIRYAPWNP